MVLRLTPNKKAITFYWHFCIAWRPLFSHLICKMHFTMDHFRWEQNKSILYQKHILSPCPPVSCPSSCLHSRNLQEKCSYCSTALCTMIILEQWWLAAKKLIFMASNLMRINVYESHKNRSVSYENGERRNALMWELTMVWPSIPTPLAVYK